MVDVFNGSGISWMGFVTQLLNFALLAIWIIGGLSALRSLRSRNLSTTAQAIWTLLIILVPALGVIAFWSVNPQGEVQTLIMILQSGISGMLEKYQ